MDELKIPEDRVACLIGKTGITKRLIEKKTKCKLEISSEGDVIIEGEALDSYLCQSIVKGVGRGFNPSIALKLLREDYVLVVISISDFCGKSKKDLIRVRARLIGEQGKVRVMLERLGEVDIVIYGKTVSIIGNINEVVIAKQALENLIRGSKHGNVYKLIRKRKDQNKFRD